MCSVVVKVKYGESGSSGCGSISIVLYTKYGVLTLQRRSQDGKVCSVMAAVFIYRYSSWIPHLLPCTYDHLVCQTSVVLMYR